MPTKEVLLSSKVERVAALKAMPFKIASPEAYTACGEIINEVRQLEKDLEAEYKEHPVIIEAKRIQAAKVAIAADLDSIRKGAKAKMIAWDDEQEAKRRAEEARLEAEAKKRAEDEAIAAAAEAEKAGDKEAAQEILETPVAVAAVVLPKETPKVAGHSVRTVWKFRITDEKKVKSLYLTPDLVKVGKQVRALGKDAEGIVGGIEVYQERV